MQKTADLKMLRACEGILSTLAAAWRHTIEIEPADARKLKADTGSEKSVALAI